jgi:short-subunit dehydrogenase
MKRLLWWGVVLGGAAALWRRTERPRVPLRDKVVLITGASSGIGRATAHAFAAAGAHVILAARRAESLLDVAGELAAYGVRSLVAPTDISRDDDVAALVEKALATFGRIDVLINNAALDLGGLLPEHDPARLRALVDVNLYGTIRLTQAIVPVMRRQGVGHIVNVASVTGRIGTPGQAAYGATKAGITGFTDALRQEVDHDGLRVTLVLPTLTRTPMIAAADEAPFQAIGWPIDAPEVPAAAIVEAVRGGRREVVLGGWRVRLALWVERLAPPLMDLYWRWAVTPAYYEAVRRFGER